MNPEFSWLIKQKAQISNFMKNLSSGSKVVPCGEMDRHDETKLLFAILQMCLKNYIISSLDWKSINFP